MTIIGLVGKMQSGKTTVAGMILNKLTDKPAAKISFANHLKEMILNAGLCTADELWGKKTDFSRLMLQKIGTEIIRKQVDPNFWIKKMIEEINMWKESNPDNLTIVIDDVRFINEAEMIKMFNGIVIHIMRPTNQEDKEENKHLSETEQDLILSDFEIINDGSLDELQQKTEEILTKIKLVN